jgi:adenylate kinase
VIRRLAGRRLAECRTDDGAATVRKRLEEYNASTAPLVNHFLKGGLLREVDATADVETVYQSIVRLGGG